MTVTDDDDNVLLFDPDEFIAEVKQMQILKLREASKKVHPSARRPDPVTSHEAAASVSEDQVSTQLTRIEREFHAAGVRGLTDEELCDRLSWVFDWAPSGIRTRRNTLSEMAVLAHVGYRPTKRGRTARVWVHAEFVLQ